MVELTLAQALERAKQAAASGKASEARAIYTAVLKAVPDHEVAKKASAELGPEQAQAQAQAVNPSKADQEALIALFNKRQFTQAAAQAEAMAQSFPKSFFVWNLLAAAQASLGQTDKAVEGFRKTIELNPNYAAGHNNMGNALQIGRAHV